MLHQSNIRKLKGLNSTRQLDEAKKNTSKPKKKAERSSPSKGGQSIPFSKLPTVLLSEKSYSIQLKLPFVSLMKLGIAELSGTFWIKNKSRKQRFCSMNTSEKDGSLMLLISTGTWVNASDVSTPRSKKSSSTTTPLIPLRSLVKGLKKSK